MNLDRNINPDGKGKYELRNMRTGEIVHDCGPYEEHEFFVLMLKDLHASKALIAYAESIGATDPQFAGEVLKLARRAGPASEFCKEPD